MEQSGVDGTLRAEQLDVITLCKLAQTYENIRESAKSPKS
jgi:hypothetical protein